MTSDYGRLLERLIPTPDGEPPVRHRTGTVSVVNADGTVDLDLGGTVVPDVSVLEGVVPVVADVVQVVAWAGDLLVLGKVAGGPGFASDTEPNSRTFTNTGYLDLDALTGGAGTITAVIATVTTGTMALVMFTAQLSNDTAGQAAFCSYRISGATTVAASDTWSGAVQSSAATHITASRTRVHTGLTPGSNVFELQARVTANTGTILRVDLAVQAVG